MERLQAAIEKARAQREDLRQGEEGLMPGQAAQASRPGPSPAQMPQEAQIAAAWAALRPIDSSGPMFTKQSPLVAFQSGGAASAYDILRTRMLHQAQTNNWRRIAIVSPSPAAGKTTTTANLAFSLARQTDYRSLFIDFDLRRVSLAHALGQQIEHTMEDVIEERIPFSEHGLRFGDNVAFGLSGRPVVQPSELLQSQRTRTALAAIEATYRPDFMIFDIPPLFAGDDSLGFLRNVDCALIVVAAEETPMRQIDAAERQVAELTQVMGIVLNKCRIANDDYSYDYDGY